MAKRLAHRPIGFVLKALPTWRTLRLKGGGQLRYRLHKLDKGKSNGHVHLEVEGLQIEGFGELKDLTSGPPRS